MSNVELKVSLDEQSKKSIEEVTSGYRYLHHRFMTKAQLIASILQQSDHFGCVHAVQLGEVPTPTQALDSIARRSSNASKDHSRHHVPVLERIAMEAIAALPGTMPKDDGIVWRGFARDYPIRVHADGRVMYQAEHKGTMEWYDASESMAYRVLQAAVASLAMARSIEIPNTNIIDS